MRCISEQRILTKSLFSWVYKFGLKKSLLETWQTLPWYANSGDGIGEITWLLKNYIWESHMELPVFYL